MSVAAGEQLRTAREARGWSVEDVATRLKLPVRYVGALESGDVGVLPEPTFVRGYVKAYAKLVALDGEALVAMQAPVEVKAPRPLVGPDGATTATTTRRSQAPRAPNFRGGVRRYHWVFGGVVAVVAAGWVGITAYEDSPTPAAPAVVGTLPALPAPAAPSPVVATGGVTMEVPLPGAQVATPAAAPVAGSAPVAAAPPVAGVAPVAVAAVPAAAAGAQAASTPPPVPAAVAVPVPRKGLYVRFTGTSWIEVRDADNIVLHTRIEMPGSEVKLEGKAPLTVTLGDAGSAQVWYNGDRLVADRFASTGITRIIAGQAGR